MDVEQRRATRSAMFRAVDAWLREDEPAKLFDPGIAMVHVCGDHIPCEALIAGLAELAARSLTVLFLDAEDPDEPTEAERQTARQRAREWLDIQVLADLDFDVSE